ncbi:MAG: response regulator transcription factor [Chloroflexi bacterium]|nr:response regulator transcription factor [Chloroflexota bacterium]
MISVPSTVLVIDSHPLMREALCFAIADEPHWKAGMQADNVSQALKLAAVVIPDIILLALNHSDQNDMKDLATLRKSLPATPILALTSDETTGQERAALEHGAQAVVKKSAPRSELLNALNRLKLDQPAWHLSN